MSARGVVWGLRDSGREEVNFAAWSADFAGWSFVVQIWRRWNLVSNPGQEREIVERPEPRATPLQIEPARPQQPIW